jgi:ATP/maltotriose-dependent transcriptional regulator MalT
MAQKWLEETPEFVLPKASLDQLAKRPKNTKAAIKQAEQKMGEMKAWPSDACSGKWYDSEGKLLLAGFAEHILPIEVKVCLNSS